MDTCTVYVQASLVHVADCVANLKGILRGPINEPLTSPVYIARIYHGSITTYQLASTVKRKDSYFSVKLSDSILILSLLLMVRVQQGYTCISMHCANSIRDNIAAATVTKLASQVEALQTQLLNT